MAEGEHQNSEELAALLADLAQRIERLKTLYEQYFMGIERFEPQVARKEITRVMLLLQQQYIRNTGLRFKFNTMLQKWSTYTTYWNRVLREIENGTYVRHLQKAARAAEEKGRALPAEMQLRGASAHEDTIAAVEAKLAAAAVAEAAEAALRQIAPAAPSKPATPPVGVKAVTPPAPPTAKPPPLPSAKPGAPPIPPGASGVVPKTPAPPPGRTPTPAGGVTISTTPPTGVPRHPTPPTGSSTVPGMSETDLRALHQKYQEARRAVGDATPVRYETLIASIAKQVPKVLEQPGVRGVRFDVAVRDGKAVLKAIPTK